MQEINLMYILVFYLQLVPVSQLARDIFNKYFICYSASENATSLFDKYCSKYYRKLTYWKSKSLAQVTLTARLLNFILKSKSNLLV